MSRRKQIKPQHISNGSDDDEDDDHKLQIDIKEDSKKVECDQKESKEINKTSSQKADKNDDITLDKSSNSSDLTNDKANAEADSKDSRNSQCADDDNKTDSRKSTTSLENRSVKKSNKNQAVSSSEHVIVTRTVARLRQQSKRESGRKEGHEKGKYQSDSDADESDQDDVESWTPEKTQASKTLRTSGRRSMTTDSPRLLGRTCEYCGAVKPTPAALQRHLRKHTGERPFVCKVCNKAYKAKRSLQLHLLSNHPDYPDKPTPQHIKQNTTAQLREVLEQKLNKEKFLDGTPGNSAPSANEHSMPREDAQTSNEKSSSEVGQPSNATLQRAEVSPFTAEESGSKGDNHAMSRTCRYCGKICLKPSDLKRHVLLHTGDKPYTCEVCGKSFKAKGSMLYHQKAAHNMNVELSQSLAERYMKLKNRSFEKSLYVQEKIAEYQHHMINGSLKEEHEDPDSLLENFHGSDDVSSKGHNSGSFGCVDGTGSEKCNQSELISDISHSGLSSSMDRKHSAFPSLLDSINFSPTISRQFSSTSDGSAEGAVSNSHDDVGDSVGTVVTGEGPFMKSRIRVKNETVLITRLDGVNLSTDKETSMYKCYICGTMLSSLRNVQVHLSMHFDLEITTYQCRHCDATFESKHQMMQHILSHKITNRVEGKVHNDGEVSDERLLMDENDEAEYQVTVDGHKKPKPDINENTELPADMWLDKCGMKLIGNWECKYCRKSFSRLYLLQRHERIHNGQRMFYCKECRKGFSESLNLQQHMIRFHDSPRGMYDQVESLPRKTDKENLQSLMRIAYWDKFSDQTTLDGSTANNEELSSAEGEQRLKDLEKAKEFLEKHGIQDDITVVMPSEPPTENDLSTSDNKLSPSHEASESDPEDPEIKAAPKRSLMSFRKEGPPSKSRRKSALPVKLDTVKCESNSEAGDTAAEHAALSSHVIPSKDIKQEVVDPGDRQDVCTSSPISTSSILSTVLSSSAVLASLNPLILASTVAAAQSSSLLAASGLASGLPATGFAVSPMPVPISVQVSETPSAGKNSSSPSRSSSSPSQPSPVDQDSLVGFPRVQWNPSPSDSSSGPSPPDGRKLQNWHVVSSDSISSDGRKVTSLSRTHSRLHVVNQPIDRDMVCKPIVLPDGRAVFRCVFCAKDFLSFSDINRHMDFHEDIRPYKCKYCDYYARTNSQLKVHMMRHQGIRDFCCKLCNYKGVTQSDLNRHMKSQIHLLKSQNECKHCREGFVTARNLEKHLDGNCVVKMHDLEAAD